MPDPGCPHGIGTPDWCSMCLGVPAKIITTDESTGRLLLDGKPVDRPFYVSNTSGQTKSRKRGGKRKGPKPVANDDDDDT